MFVVIILHHAYKQLQEGDHLKVIVSNFHLLNLMIRKEVNTDRTQLHDGLLQSNIELKP